MLGPNGVKQRREMFRPFGVWRAFKLNVLLHAFRVQVGRHGKAVRNFPQGLVELLKNGQVPELDQGVGGEPDGVEVVLVELDVVDAVSVFGVVVAPFITMVFDGSVVAQIGFVAHRPQVLLNGGDADAFPVAAVEGLFTGQTQRFFGWKGVAWVGQAAVNDAVPQEGVFVRWHVSGERLCPAARIVSSWPIHEGHTADRGCVEVQ